MSSAKWRPMDDTAKTGAAILILFVNTGAWFKAAWLYTESGEGPFWLDPDTGERQGDDPAYFMAISEPFSRPMDDTAKTETTILRGELARQRELLLAVVADCINILNRSQDIGLSAKILVDAVAAFHTAGAYPSSHPSWPKPPAVNDPGLSGGLSFSELVREVREAIAVFDALWGPSERRFVPTQFRMRDAAEKLIEALESRGLPPEMLP